MNLDQISPKLVGDKVVFGPFREDLNDTYRRWLHDLKNGFGLHPGLLLTHEQETDWLRNNVNANGVFFTIYDKQTETPIGTIAFVGIDQVSRTAELGIVIGENEYKNKGYGKESLLLMLDYGFNIVNLESIFLRVHACNERAAALYEKVGFKLVGRRRKACYIAGKYYDDIIMDILKEEFNGQFIQSKLNEFLKHQ